MIINKSFECIYRLDFFETIKAFLYSLTKFTKLATFIKKINVKLLLMISKSCKTKVTFFDALIKTITNKLFYKLKFEKIWF